MRQALLQSVMGWIFFLTLALALALTHAAPLQAQWYSYEWQAMGTQLTLKLWTDDPDLAQRMEQEAKQEIVRLNRLLSTYESESEISLLNRKSHAAPVSVSPEVFRLLSKSEYYANLTRGAFDITYASVGHRYHLRHQIKPDDETIQNLLPAVDYAHVVLAKDTRQVSFRHPQTQIDLGGIAKGYAVDRVAQLLRENQVKHAMFAAGGDSRLLGDRRGQPWMVGIKDPRQEAMALVIPLENTAVSTSGDYERYFLAEGERVHHILSPKSGKPAAGIQSVTVIGPTAADTDALATALFVMGTEQGMALVEDMAGYDAVFIDANRSVHYSSGLLDPNE